ASAAPGAAKAEFTRGALAPAAAGTGRVESHWYGVAAVKRTVPSPSLRVTLPSVSALTDRPSALTGKCSRFSAGLAAAAAGCTTMTSGQAPPVVAVTWRSTSGRTSV